MFRKLFLAFFFVPALACPQVQERQPAAVDSGTPGRRDVVIGPNDAITIMVMDEEEISKTWRVGTAGDLNLPLVGKIQAAGKTVDELEIELAQQLKAYIRDPQVHVYVANLQSQPVTVLGAVGSPGTLQLEGRKTLLDVLMLTGGPKEAGPTLTLTRKTEYGRIPLPEARDEENGKYSVASLSVSDVMSARTPASNLVIQPYDVISVSPQVKTPKLVHIIGEVTKPGAIELVQQQSVSIMQALAAAGGSTRTASLSKTIILHVNPDGVRTEVAIVDLKKIMEGKVKDLELIPGDIIVVPSSQLKTYLDISAKTLAGSGPLVLARF
jgi:polysaccharide export outer membrane protein